LTKETGIFLEEYEQILHSQNCEKGLLASSYLFFCLSIRPCVCLSARNNVAKTVLIVMKFDI